MKVGVLLPHFSDACGWERLIGFVGEIERLGFDAIWVRDHISYSPGAFDPPGTRFVDPFVVLAAAAGRTSRIQLGFAVLVPLRHPLVTAQLLGSLDWVSKGRVSVGFGVGGPSKQFEVLGMPYGERVARFEETLEVLDLAMEGQPLSYSGRFSQFQDAIVDPALGRGATRWYGGFSPVAIRRALRYCNGLMPSRVPFAVLDPAWERYRSLAAAAGKRVLLGTAPLLVIDRSHEATVEVAERAEEGVMKMMARASGSERPMDPAGAVVRGTPEECITQLVAFASRRVDEIILDCRLMMDRFEDAITLFADEVLPAIRRM